MVPGKMVPKKNGPRKNGPREKWSSKKWSPENWSPKKWSLENWSPEKWSPKNLSPEKWTFLGDHFSRGPFFRDSCTSYMHASATSIEVTALCNVHRFFPVLLKLRKIKIVKYSSTIFWPILCDCKVHFSFWQHCSSCNINFPSIATNNITSKMNQYNSSRYIHTLWSLQPGKKAVASENTWFI